MYAILPWPGMIKCLIAAQQWSSILFPFFFIHFGLIPAAGHPKQIDNNVRPHLVANRKQCSVFLHTALALTRSTEISPTRALSLIGRYLCVPWEAPQPMATQYCVTFCEVSFWLETMSFFSMTPIFHFNRVQGKHQIMATLVVKQTPGVKG